MTEKPIIMQGWGVRATLEGRKTNTRRVIKPQPWGYDPSLNKDGLWEFCDDIDFDPEHHLFKCPYGAPGDELWVREKWATVNTESGPALAYDADKEVINWLDFCTEFGPDYGVGPSMDYQKYPGDYTMWWSDLFDGAEYHSWKPSIHMPRWASRIQLRVTDIRVERLQDISEEDAKAEGVDKTCLYCGPEYPECQGTPLTTYQGGFIHLWDSINGKKYPWSSNCWVWVVEFEVIK